MASTTRGPKRERLRSAGSSVAGTRWGPVGALVLLMAAVIAYALPYALGISSFFVQPDEMTYVRGAMHIAETGRPVLPGDFWWSSFAQLLPLLMAPGYALFSATTAFEVAHGVQAVVFVSAAIPVFLLSRRLTPSRWAPVLAAALSVLVPWLAMSGSLMTEPTAYTAFAWSLLALQVCLERGGVRGDLIGAAGIVLAFVARTQLIVLGPVLLAAAVLHEVGFAAAARPAGARGRVALAAIGAALRRHAVLFGLAALGLLALLAGGGGDLLGSYKETGNRIGLPAGTFDTARDMFGAVIVAVGVLPLALAPAWWLLTLARPSGRAAHAFASLSVVGLPILLLSAGVYVVELAAEQDRYTMYAAPILAIGAAMLLADGRRALPALVVGVAAAAALLATTTFPPGVRGMPAPGRVINDVLDGRIWQLGHLAGIDHLETGPGLAGLVVLAGVVLALAWWRRVPATAIAVVTGALLVLGAAGNMIYTVQAFKPFQAGVSDEFRAGRNWVDQTLGDRRATGIVGVVYDPAQTSQVFWETYDFNRTAVSNYALEPQDLYGQGFADYVRIDHRGRMHDLEQEPYVLMSQSDGRIGFRGAREVQVSNGLVLRRVPKPYQLDWALERPDGEGKVVGGTTGAVRVYGDGRAGRREVELLFASSIGSGREYDVRIGGGRPARRRVPLGKVVGVKVGVDLPASGSVRVPFRVGDPAAAPENPPGGVRLVGARVQSSR